MLKTITYAFASLLTLAAALAQAQTPATPDYFKPFEFLVGNCWTGTFPGGKATDTHCFEWLYGREFIRDRHSVKSNGPDYKGETVYHFDHATKLVTYRYWNSDGGLSEGTMQADARSINSPEELYRDKDGKAQKFSSRIERVSDTQYLVSTRSWDGKAWQDAWTITFTRTDFASPAAPLARQEAVDKAVRQLRETRGRWNVTTEFLKPDGSVAKSVNGTYEFDWVVDDRVLKGVSDIPELANKSGILFYVNEGKGRIEMASVAKDGHLWVMTGPADGETRTTPDTPMSDGSTMKLRFTRYNVGAGRFESKMEVSTDGGATWVPGNHQVFLRAPGGAPH